MTKFRSSLILLILISMLGCSSSNDKTVILNAAGKHPAGWSAVGSHGSAAKAATPGLGNCAECHGADYNEAGKSCMTCHTTAPHPATPWRGTTATGTTHITTDPANAPNCGRCHAGNARLTIPGAALTGATCFNNTLCHGAVGHPAGWSAAASHGSAAKATPGASQGLAFCTQCHGTNYVNGSAKSCKSCHTTAPHPASPWRGTGTTHTTTDQGNAVECSRCHAGNARLATPVASQVGAGCFNGTLCHASVVGHTIPYSGSAHLSANTTDCLTTCHVLGSAASPYPTAGTAPNCRSCHLTANPGTTPQCSDCHGSVANDKAGAKKAGRPTGSTFPNRTGRHNESDHVGLTCTLCHSFTSGDSRHGWSGGAKSSAAEVKTGALITSWDPATKNCTALCHENINSIRTW